MTAVAREALFELFPFGFPSAMRIGPVVNITVFIPGPPAPKGRHRSRVVTPKGGGKPWVQNYTDAKTVAWEERVAAEARSQITSVEVAEGGDFTLPLTGRMMISLRFNLHRPTSYPKSVEHHLKRPDVDNLAKAVLDGLQNANIMTEDNLVTDLTVAKRYVSDGHPEGVEIDITGFLD